jgi:hypothetical protein
MATDKDQTTTKDQSAALQAEQVKAQKDKAVRPPPPDADPPEVITLGPDASVSTTLHAVDEFVIVDKDVVVEFYPEGTKRPSHYLLFHKGQRVLRSQLEKALHSGAATNPVPTGAGTPVAS